VQHVTNAGVGGTDGGGEAGEGGARGRSKRTKKSARGRIASPVSTEAVSRRASETSIAVGTTVESRDPQLLGEFHDRLNRLEAWRRLFLTTRPIADRLTLLHDFGLTDHDLAAAIPKSKARAIRRWRTTGPPSTRTADIWRAVDDLYYTVSYFLADGSYDEDAIIAWLRSRQRELYDRRPLEVLASRNFDDVRAAAEAVLCSGSGVLDEDLVQPPASLRPDAVPKQPPVERE